MRIFFKLKDYEIAKFKGDETLFCLDFKNTWIAYKKRKTLRSGFTSTFANPHNGIQNVGICNEYEITRRTYIRIRWDDLKSSWSSKESKTTIISGVDYE